MEGIRREPPEMAVFLLPENTMQTAAAASGALRNDHFRGHQSVHKSAHKVHVRWNTPRNTAFY